MLAADRGVPLNQNELIGRWRLDSADRWAALNGLSPGELARLLTLELNGSLWRGGDTSLQEPSDVLHALRGRSWAALLGPGRMGHWVVVDGLDRTDRVAVRDPTGHRRRFTVGAWTAAWYHREAVFEVNDG